ncbi:hypothetical protein NKDENANG_02429 [Candidatus Entotheonellaceae bacterium PAL068K]
MSTSLQNVIRHMSESQTYFATYADFIPEFSAFCEALYATPICCLRVKTRRTRPDRVQDILARQGYQALASPVAPELRGRRR